MKRIFYILFFTISFLGTNAQYYPQYSQYLLNGIAVNPAFTGSREVLSANVLYRDQWIGFEGAPKTMTFSAHTPLRSLSSAIGVQLFNDKIGVSSHTGIFVSYAYRIRFKRNNRTLAFGLGLGADIFRANLNKVTTLASGDGTFENQIYKSTRPNFSSGIYYYAKRFFAGFSSPALLRYGYDVYSAAPDSVSTQPANYFFTIGYTFKLNKDIKIRPSLLRKSYPGQDSQIDLNLSLIVYDALNMAISVRGKESLVWILEYRVNDQIKIGYSHDFVTSRLNKYSHGTNEFLLRYELSYKSDKTNIKFF